MEKSISTEAESISVYNLQKLEGERTKKEET